MHGSRSQGVEKSPTLPHGFALRKGVALAWDAFLREKGGFCGRGRKKLEGREGLLFLKKSPYGEGNDSEVENI